MSFLFKTSPHIYPIKMIFLPFFCQTSFIQLNVFLQNEFQASFSSKNYFNFLFSFEFLFRVHSFFDLAKLTRHFSSDNWQIKTEGISTQSFWRKKRKRKRKLFKQTKRFHFNWTNLSFAAHLKNFPIHQFWNFEM